MNMDPLHFCIAVAPLSVYMLLIGMLNLGRSPFVTTGARDVAALAIGILGFVIAGPMELFFPESAASQYGPLVWVMLIVFYSLCVSLIVLMMRARIVIYNATTEQVRPVLTAVAMKLDPRSRWAGNSLLIPKCKVHLHLEPSLWLRNIQLTAGGNEQSHEGWRELEFELKQALKATRIGPNLISIPLLMASAALAIGAAWWMLADQTSVAAAFEEMKRL